MINMFDKKDLMVDDDSEFPYVVVEDPVDDNNIPILEQPFTDVLIYAEAKLPHDGRMQLAKVIGHSRSDSGEYKGTYNNNPLLDSILYHLEFPDGVIKQYAANTIAVNMISQITNNRQTHLVLDMILDWKTDGNTIPKD